MGLIQALQTAGEPNMYYPIFAHVTGTVTAGVFLSKMLFWEGQQKDPDGWIYKTQTDITAETGLSRHETDTVKKSLGKLGVLETKKAGVPAKTYYRFIWNVLEGLVEVYLQKKIDAVAPALEGKIEPETSDVVATQLGVPGAVTPPKEKPFIHKMVDTFNVYHAEAFPGLPYNFTDKDFGQLKNLDKALRKLMKHQKEESVKKKNNGEIPAGTLITVSDDEALAAWDVFLQKLPKHDVENNFYPSSLYSNFSAIVQRIKKENGNGNSGQNNSTGNTGNNRQTGGSFADAARAGGAD